MIEGREMALLTLSHTRPEHQLYQAMLAEVAGAHDSSGAFSIGTLMRLSGIRSSTSLRRALSGLLRKLSIQMTKYTGEDHVKPDVFICSVFDPDEIFKRRREAGLRPYPKDLEVCEKTPGFSRAVERVVGNSNLSRREAQVALACAEGLTNAEIGRRLFIGEQTVKFHLRNVFAKFGVRRRTGLISHLLVASASGSAKEELKVLDTI
jgi:DNA-binding CsgD family transcriptional regulator